MELFQFYLQQQAEGVRAAYVAIKEYAPAGYVTLRFTAKDGPFQERGYPELQDLYVLDGYRRQGIGSLLMEQAERKAKEIADHITLAVGLHAGYGPAQQLYSKRGYVPDGTGVWYQKQPLAPYSCCKNDDELVLYLSKQFNE